MESYLITLFLILEPGILNCAWGFLFFNGDQTSDGLILLLFETCIICFAYCMFHTLSAKKKPQLILVG